MRSRHSYGLLQTIGLTETIACNKVEYLEIAVELGRNSSWRSSLQQKMKNNPRIYTQLFENPQCAASLEKLKPCLKRLSLKRLKIFTRTEI